MFVKMIVRFHLGIAILLGTCSPAYTDDGVSAYKRGDYARALEFWQHDANAGDAIAAYNLATLYYYGNGVGENHAEAAKWYTQSGLKGFAKAQSALGMMYDKGDGVQTDKFTAMKWLQMAAEQFDKKATARLKGLAAEELDRLAKKLLGTPGESIPKNKQLEFAATHGSIYAANQMAYRYVDGLDVEKDDATAVKWYRIAAEQGDPTGQYNLGMMYLSDRGVPPSGKVSIMSNMATGYFWLQLAANQGHPSASTIIAGLSSTQVTFSQIELHLIKTNVEKWKPTPFQEPALGSP